MSPGDILDTDHCQCGGELEFSDAFPHLVSCSRCHYGGNLDAMARVIRPNAYQALADLSRLANLSRRREQQWVGRLELPGETTESGADGGIFRHLFSLLDNPDFTKIDYHNQKRVLRRRQRQDGLRRASNIKLNPRKQPPFEAKTGGKS